MQIKKVVVGPLQENCYILLKDGNAIVIDPGDEYEKIKKEVGNDRVVAILITHHHFDHVGALPSFSKEIPVYDASNGKENITIGNFQIQVISTPGHTSDSISFYFEEENVLFSGDFLFYESIGRTDFPTGNMEEMKKSIQNIKRYPKEMKIYPGHGMDTTLKHELMNNVYFTEKD